ncbi:MAG: redoxin domain-containing protein [Acidiferrobacterales bacterium]
MPGYEPCNDFMVFIDSKQYIGIMIINANYRVVINIALGLILVLLSLALFLRYQDLKGAENFKPVPLPEFTQTNQNAWLNSKPLQVNDLKGKVVLMDIWTFECWNCYRSFPWLKQIEKNFPADLQVIGIHTPEFAHEKIRKNVVAKTREFGLAHPVMMDNDFAYWKALNNRYWPAFYVIDKKGIIRGRYIGEIHVGDRNANAVEKLVRKLIAEK